MTTNNPATRRSPDPPHALTIPPPATVATQSSLRSHPHPHSPFGPPLSGQGRLQVEPGASVPLGYGGMSTGVFISVAVTELPRLAPALRRPVPPRGPSHAPTLRLGQSTPQCQQSPGSAPAAVHLPHGSGGRSGIHTHTPLAPTNRINAPTLSTRPDTQAALKIADLSSPPPSSSLGNAITCPSAPPTYRATDPIYKA